MDGALQSVLARSRELAGQALKLEAQSADLAKALAAAQARIAQLEAAEKAQPRPPAPASEDPGPLP
jgi:peptidoglycan hydrolase CwlO-like protein